MRTFASDSRQGDVYASSRQLSQRVIEESHTYAAEPWRRRTWWENNTEMSPGNVNVLARGGGRS